MKRITSVILILTLAVLMLTGCGEQKTTEVDTEKQQSISIKVATPSGAPTISMIRKFKENPSLGENVEVSYESVKSPDLMASRILSG